MKDGPPLAQMVRATREAPQHAEPTPELADGSDPGTAAPGPGAAYVPGQPACPGDDTLVALVEKTLDGERVAALADHVDRCERCRATVGALAGSDEPATAKQVGRYELRDQLGFGGMGVVWSAWDPMLERRVCRRQRGGDRGAPHAEVALGRHRHAGHEQALIDGHLCAVAAERREDLVLGHVVDAVIAGTQQLG